MRIALAALLLCVGVVLPAYADDPALTVGGQVRHELRLSLHDLRTMPQTKVAASFQTHNGKESGKFSGVLLWNLLEQASMSDDGKKSATLRHVIKVTGRDGYSVVLSAGEIAPDFGHAQAIVALAKDGHALKAESGLRLIVPGDIRGGRAVHDVVSIEVQ